MKINYRSLEYSLLGASLVFAFLYFVFRSLVWDHFIWILIVPAIGFIYAAAIGPSFFLHRSNALDKAIKWYLIYGVLITALVVFVLNYGNTLGIKYFIHYYAPAILYFIARRYTRLSSANITKVTALIWILALVFIVDVSVEYYVVIVQQKPLAIPWKRSVVLNSSDYDINYWNQVEEGSISAPQMWNRQSWGLVHSFMKGRKATGMVAVVLFAFIVPYYYMDKKSRSNVDLAHRWRFNSITNLAILIGLMWIAYIAMNKVEIGAGIFVLGLGFVLTRSAKLGISLVVLVALGAVVFSSLIADIWNHAVVVDAYDYGFGETQTPFQRTIDIRPVLRGYANTPIDVLLAGHYERLPWIIAFKESKQTMLGLGFPARFGLMWGLIVAIGLAISSSYCLTLFRNKQFSILGLACLGVLLVYAVDLHDPSSVRHGPFELAFILAGTLSSAREMARERVPEFARSTKLRRKFRSRLGFRSE